MAARSAALKALHLREPQTLQVIGVIEGVGLNGTFHSWTSPRGRRFDQLIGSAMQSSVRTADGRQYAVDDNGNVREIRGLMEQRDRTEDFIEEEHFVDEPRYDTFKGALTLPGGRSVYAIEVDPPGGLPEEIDLDARTLMIDRLTYDESDGVATTDFSDYKTFGGALVAQHEVESNGDHAFDLSSTASHIIVDAPIQTSVFDVPKNNEVQVAGSLTVPLVEHDGHYYTRVRIHGRDYTFLVDTGAQAVILDSRVAAELGLHPEGHLEVAGTQRVGGLGIAELDGLQIGGATLPLRTVSVLNISNATGPFQADGVLGYPFFASAEVRFDAANGQMTFARPGTLTAAGSAIPIDVDREMVETQARVNGVDGRFVLDTGNSGELLLFSPFMKAHPHLLPAAARSFAQNYGVGGPAGCAGGLRRRARP